MSDDLAEELERIARLRGKDPAAYTPHANSMAADVTLDAGRLLHNDGALESRMWDLAVYDSLPEPSRRFLSEHPYALNSMVYADFLRAWHGNEPKLLERLNAVTPLMVQRYAASHYARWPTHPQAKETP